MKKQLLILAFPLLSLAFAPFALQAQPGGGSSFGFAVQLNPAYAVTANNGFQDPQIEAGITYGWLNRVNSGTILEGQYIFYLPFGFRFHIGYHAGSFPEQEAGAELWQNIFDDEGQEFQDDFFLKNYTIRNKMQGLNVGLAYAWRGLSKRVHPYVFGEVRTESFRSTMRLEGEAFQMQTYEGPASGPYTGSSRMYTKSGIGYGAGVGVEVALGRFVLAPEWKYVSVSAEILDRESEYAILPAEGAGSEIGVRRDREILPGQEIALRYHQFRIGFRYILF
jgi:hypothetical protein